MCSSIGIYGLERVVSGGQTGVDRAALDAAINAGFAHGGWCPLGRRAEDGPIDPRYQLQECELPDYPVRTERNVVDSDGTLILHLGQVQGGTELTRRLARRYRKPLLLFDITGHPQTNVVAEWLQTHQIRQLNVAGPRESSSPGITQAAYTFLMDLFCAGGNSPSG